MRLLTPEPHDEESSASIQETPTSDVSLAGNDDSETPHVTSELAPPHDLIAPREIVREVAGNLKALSQKLPYAEYAAIVHRIAHLRWRCEMRMAAGALHDALGDTEAASASLNAAESLASRGR